MAEQGILFGDGYRAVLRVADGSVVVVWVPDTDMQSVLDRIRFLMGAGIEIQDVHVEKVD